MKQQHLVLLGGLVLGLLVYNIATTEGDVTVNKLADSSIELATFQASSAAGIVVAKGDTKIELKKDKEQWKLSTGHLADQRKATELVEDMAALRAEVRPANSEQLELYGLDEKSTKTRVAVLGGDGKDLGSVTIGKKGPDWGTAFTKRPSQDEVLLLAEGPVGRVASGELKLSSWIDATATRFELDKTTSLKISGTVSAEFSRKMTVTGDAGPQMSDWVHGASAPFDAEKLASLLNRLDGLYLKEPLAEAGDEAKLTFDMTGGVTRKIELLSQPEEGDARWVRIDGLGYVVGKSSFENVEKALAEAMEPKG